MSVARLLRRTLYWLLSLPLILLLLGLLIAGFAVSTETGFNSLLALAQRVLPGQLSYDQASGRLLGPLRIEGLRYQDGPLRVALASGEFDWQPADLFDAALNVTRLHVDGLELDLPPGEDTPPSNQPLELPDIQLPLALAVADLHGRNIEIRPAGAEPVRIDAVTLKARTEAETLLVEVLDVRSPLADVRLDGRIAPVGGYPLQIRLDWRAPVPEYGDFKGTGELSGALRDRLELTQKISGAAALELRGEVRQALAKEPAWSATVKLDVADLKPFAPDLAGKPLAARIKAQGVLTRFEGQGEIQATLPELGPATLRFSAAGDDQAVRLDTLKLTAADRPLALDAKGDLQFAELRFKASGQWRSLVWPLTGPAQVESASGEFAAEGTPLDYRFRFAAELQGPEIPKGRWTFDGQGSDQAVRAIRWSGQTLEGTLEGTVDATWAPAVSWNATLAGAGLNPGAQWKEVPGKLNLRLKSDGGLDNGKLRANVLLEELAGTLSGQSVRGSADVSVLDQDLTIKTLRLNAGPARLEAEGVLAKRWDLRWTLDAPELKSLLPGLSGGVASTGTLGGSRDRPRVATRFTVRNLRQGDTQIQSLQGEADVDVGGRDRSRLTLTGEGLVLGGQRWKSVTLDGGGTPDAHELKAELSGDPGRFALALAGKLQLPALAWQGRITQLTAKDTLAGAWSLEKAVAVQAAADKASLDGACLVSAPTRLCLQGQWNGTRGFNGRARLQNLQPERFKQFLPPGMNLTTRIDAQAEANGGPNGALQGKLNLDIAPGALQMLADGRTLRFTLKGGTLRAQTDGRTATGQLKLDLAQTGQLQADAQVRDPLGAARVDGKIVAAITDLGIVSLFAPQAQEVTGQLRADVNVTGALPKLVLRGAIRLENAGAAIPAAGIKLENLQFAATSTGQGPLQLSGSVRSKPGQLQLSGEVEPLKPQLRLSIKGQDFQAYDTSDIRIRLSPDLNLDITRELVRVEGQVVIPQAYLSPGGVGDGPSPVASSEDVVIVNDRDGKANPQAKGPALHVRVRVILGDDVQVVTPAFQGKLRGNLLVVQTPELAPRGSGSAEIVAGTYKIYGTEIDIQRGRVLFSNSPLDNPGLDIRVARTFNSRLSDDTTVGAQVQGTLKKPRLTLFSDPSMPQGDILSYLVLGRAPQGGGGESAMLFKAASALGVGGDALAKGLGSAVGLDTVQLDTGNNGKNGTDEEGTSLTLGKYLTPDLYVGYGVGLINAVNTIYIKYRLTKRLMFESDSSVLGYGADLIYNIER
ncbi:MAG: translocation/assembly module TamB domain-containing protein [Candidatus Competibacter sp.]|nr:translocation/assembly module TamB domain-containing protein [Candidatus Competibacter sp.]MDG4584312.1 translocation/assembly module TamB domain-containing protein [Candidatus Competibacter sp.]